MIPRLERWITRRGRWWDGLLVLAFGVAVTCSPQEAHAGGPVHTCIDPSGNEFTAGWGMTGPAPDEQCTAIGENPGPQPWSDVPDPDGDGYLPRPAADTLAADLDPAAEDSYEVDGQALTETELVHAYLEHLHAIETFLRAHQVERWRPLAACESGERWTLNARHDGGLQFAPSTWRAMGGLDFAAYAWQAEPWQQAEVADRLVAYEQAEGRGGYGPWPSCARQLGLPR